MARKTKEAAQETRHAILDAAERVFQANGVARTSLAEIAAAAGVTRGAIYWHFDNKVALFDAMMDRVFAPIEAKFSELQQAGGDNPVDALCAFTLHFIDRVAEDPAYSRALEIMWHKCEYVGEMATLRDIHLECGNRYLDALTDGFARARARGDLDPATDPRTAAIGLMALVDGLVVNWTLDANLFPLRQAGPALVRGYLDSLAPRNRAAP